MRFSPIVLGDSPMDCHQVQLEKILTHIRRSFQTSLPPPPPPQKKTKKTLFLSTWLSQFDLLRFDEKNGTMHDTFHFSETRSTD